MEVVLTQDIARVGKKHETVSVSNGYGRNYLIPRGLAVAAASTQGKTLAQTGEHRASQAAASAEQKNAAIAALDGVHITLNGAVNESGTLYKRIRDADVAEAATAQTDGVTINATDVALDEAITAPGQYQVQITNGETSANVTVTVSDE